MYKVTSISFIQENPAAIKKFQMQARNLWNDYVWRIRNYLVSSMAGLQDTSTAAKWLLDTIDELSSVIEQYYDAQIAEDFKAKMRDIASLIAAKIEAIKQGKSVAMLQPVDYDAINSLADILEKLNPVYWKKDIVKPILEKTFELWVNQIMSRAATEWQLDLQHTDTIHDEILKFADIFSNGIVAQNPQLFSVGEEYAL